MRSREEHVIQSNIVKCLRNNNTLVFAIPNGQLRNKMIARMLKIEGVLAGVSDLIILTKHARCFFVEVKTPTGRQSESQKEFQRLVENLGFTYEIWRSLDCAIDFIKGSNESIK